MVKLLTWLKPFIPSWMALLPYVLGGVGLVSLYFYGEHVGYNKAKNKYTQEIAQIHEQDDRVTALAWKAKSDAERVYKQKADEADQSYSDLASKYNLNLLRFKQLQGITRTSNPSSIFPVNFPLTLTEARPTRWTTARMSGLYHKGAE